MNTKGVTRMSSLYAKTVVNLALKEVGYYEKKTNASLNDKTANKGNNNFNKYADYIDKNYPTFYNTKKNGYDWCDIFVDYLFIKSFGLDSALFLTCQPLKSCGAGCVFSSQYYNSKKQFSKTPKFGSQIFFGSDFSNCYHTGVVYDFDDTYVYTVEGNSSDCVAKRKYKRIDPKIFGYGHPKYDVETPKPTPEKTENPNKTIVNEAVNILAKQVIQGKWDSGQKRADKIYKAVQTRVNEIFSNPNSLPSNNNGVELMAKQVIAGLWDVGLARKEKIYNAVQMRVNEMMKDTSVK